MAAKKAKRPALRYLLSADPGLRKLSMKKLAERGNKTKAGKRAARTKPPATRAVETARWPWTASGRTMVLSGIGVLAAATLFAAGRIADGTDAPLAGGMPTEPRYTAEAAPSAPTTREAPAPRISPHTADVRKPPTTNTKAAPAPGVTTTAFEPEPAGGVTISGCLVKNKDGFSLKDASGGPVTKGRSWRTGFFKKSSPRVGVVAASGGLRLSEYVDERVSATGVLADGQLRVRSMRRIATSCD